jgi:hypothetical protein
MRNMMLCCFLFAGCGTDEADDDLLADVPRTADLGLRGLDEGGASGAAADRPLSPLYVVTRRTSAELNGMVAAPLDLVWRIAQSPPSLVGDGTAVWGPITDALSPATYRLVARRVGPGAVRYWVEGRPKDGSADFRAVVTGMASADQGEVGMDFTLARALDPAGGIDQDGGMAATYQRAPDHAAVALQIEAGATSALYAYTQARDGGGAMDFGAEVDGMGAVEIHARWAATGAGRADARASDGAARSECWDPLGALTVCQAGSAK